ncbi:MAG: class I SAM-dependent methyltransferase [Usitatibacter sp.]
MNLIQAVLGKRAATLAASHKPVSIAALSVQGRTALGEIEVHAPIVFGPALLATIRWATGETRLRSSDTVYVNWLPRGRYAFRLALPAGVPPGAATIAVSLFHQQSMASTEADAREVAATLITASGCDVAPWVVEAVPPARAIAELAWNKGHADWFFRHFDHAATTIMSYMLGDSPLLRERVLDVGCGDGITDLGIALRAQSRQFIGIDPFKGFERLAKIVADNQLPADLLPSNLGFRPDDANHLPFEDDSFDVVISWGSVEHMAGGYMRALNEVKRVLVPDGLFLVVPGLFYSDIGHHLGEFSSEPFFHLKKTPGELRRMVLETPPNYMDRSGEFATNEQYWQWHTELNRITVGQFERELRALGFEPWRVALRTNPLIEYTPEMQPYSFEQLATNELYVSCYNRKKKR